MRLCKFCVGYVALVLCISAMIALPQLSLAQDHVVSPADLGNALADSTATRQKQIAQIDEFLASKQAREALQLAHLDYQQIQIAVPSLSNEDLARMSARTQQINNDFAAGLSNRDLLWLAVIGVAIIIVVVIATRHHCCG